MHPLSALIEKRDTVLRQIVDEHVEAHLPGESDFHAFAREVCASALLGHLPSAEDAATLAVLTPALPELPPAPLSPDAPVEPAPEISPSDVVVPGALPPGETSEEVPALPPTWKPKRPYTRRKEPAEAAKPSPKAKGRVKSGALPAAETPAATVNTPGSSGAIYQARAYVLTCLDKGEGVNLLALIRMTGWERPTAQKFVTEIMDARARVKSSGKRAPDTTPNLDANFARLAEAIHGAGEEDEDEAEAEKVFAGNGKRKKPLTLHERETAAAPPWWSNEFQRVCQNKGCGKVLPPRRPKGCWESLQTYQTRQFCSTACVGKARGGNNRKPFPVKVAA